MLPFVRPMARAIAMALPAALMLATASTASAQITPITSRSGMTGPTINWGSMYSGTVNQGVFTPTGIPGLSVRPFSALAVNAVAEGNGWNGGFTQGDPVLNANNPSGGALGLLFNTDIFGFGANMQGAVYGDFTGRIEAWDAVGNLLGSHSFDAVSSSTDGSASFFGMRSSTGIRLITMDVYYANQLDASLGINQATVELAPMSTVVPEPSTVALFAAGLASLTMVARRRTRVS